MEWPDTQWQDKSRPLCAFAQFPSKSALCIAPFEIFEIFRGRTPIYGDIFWPSLKAGNYCIFMCLNLFNLAMLLKCLAFLMRSYFANLLRFCKTTPKLVQKKETPTQCKAFQKRIATEFKDKEKQLFSETTPTATKKSMKDLPTFFLPSLPICYVITDIQSCCCFACGCSLVVCSRETSYTTWDILVHALTLAREGLYPITILFTLLAYTQRMLCTGS